MSKANVRDAGTFQMRRAAHSGLASLVAGILMSAVATGATMTSAHAQDCGSEAALKSAPSSKLVELTFQNNSSAARKLYWLDQNGDRKPYAMIAPGAAHKQPSYSTHVWVVTDGQDNCVQVLAAPATATTIAIADAPAVMAPPQVAQQVAPPPAGAAPPDAAAMQVSDAVDVPQVSPVEQFELDGNFRIAPATGTGEVLNSRAGGTIRAARVKPESSSGQWSFEPVPGSPYVRIRSDWKKTYLIDDDGKPEAKAAEPADDASHWTYEPVDGTSYIQFRNRATERFLMLEKGVPVLADDYDQDQEKQAFWSVTSTGADVVAVAPAVSPAYAAALSDCREIGGVWTGASCRAVYAERPLNCGRGWAWDADLGECVWDGPQACPPWQISRGGLCFAELTCRGGRVRPSRHGLSCQCPIGMAAWGNYPNLSCKPSLARILPLFVPLIANQVRPANNQAGNNRRPGGQNAGNNRRPGGGQNAGRNPNRQSLGAVGQIPFGQTAVIGGAGNRPGGNRPAAARPGGNRPAGNRPAGLRPAGLRPAGTQQATPQPQRPGVIGNPAAATPPQPGVIGGRPPGGNIAVTPPVVKQTTAPPPPAPPPPIVKQVRPSTSPPVPVVKQTNAPPSPAPNAAAQKAQEDAAKAARLRAYQEEADRNTYDPSDEAACAAGNRAACGGKSTRKLLSAEEQAKADAAAKAAQEAHRAAEARARADAAVKAAQQSAAQRAAAAQKAAQDAAAKAAAATAAAQKAAAERTKAALDKVRQDAEARAAATKAAQDAAAKATAATKAVQENAAKAAAAKVAQDAAARAAATKAAQDAAAKATAATKAVQENAAKAAAAKVAQDAAARAAAAKAAQDAAARAAAAQKAAAAKASQDAAARAAAAAKAAQQAAAQRAAAAQKAAQQAAAQRAAAAAAAAQRAAQQAAVQRAAAAAAQKAALQKTQQDAINRAKAAAAAQQAAATARAAAACKPPRKFVGGQCK